jgi:hypothetical protein
VPGLVICAALQGGAYWVGHTFAFVVAIGLSGLVAIWQLRQIHR